MTAPIQDLRDAIALLQQHDNQYLETDHPVDPNAELAGVYRHIGAGGTVKRPTRIGPAMMFNNIKGYPHSRILVGMHASRQRAALLLGCEASQLALEVGKAVKKPVAPVVVPASSAPCQEQIFLADDPDFDLRTLLPAPTNTPIDAGPFFCLGLALASDPDDASLTDVTIHRLCVQGRDELSMFLAAGRHIEVFRQKAEAAGKPLPITINMGLDPAIYIGACFEAPTTPFGYNELGVAGALRQRPVELVQGVSVPEKAIARAEIVIEGELLPGVRVREDQHTNSGHAMPEFPGYCGGANPSLPVIKVKAVTMRNNAILQTLVGPGEEHTTLAGLPTEASIWNAVEAAIPGFLQNVYAHTAGGGKFLGILQVKKRQPADEGRQGQAALLALAITGCAGWYIYRNLGSNLTAISRAMSRLAQGEPNVSVPALQRRDELGELARAFNVFARNMASLEHTTRLLKEKTNQMEIDRIKRQELEEALLHSQKMKAVGQLTGGLAHDFNNLLAVIIGSLELVEPDARDAPRLSRALKAAERGALLTQRLLAFSRKQALHPQAVAMAPLLENLS
ncbi:hypothetical protein CWN26_17090, partial [Klebsiella pneumoniae]